MAQVYGCIECGMLFAGWEYCLTHIEHCRPQHYLEVDKKTLKHMCMIGHRRCLVPAYQPAMIRGNYGTNSGESTTSAPEGDLNEEIFSNESSSESDGSDGLTTLTGDFLNPVEKGLRHVANVVMLQEDEQRMEERRQSSGYDGQEQMMMQLFDKEDAFPKSMESGSSRRSRSRKNKPSPKGGEEGDMVTDTAGKPVNLKKELHRIEKCLHQLIRESSPIAKDEPKLVLLQVLPKIYEIQSGTKLDYQALGFPDIKALLRAIPSVEVIVMTPYYNIEHEYLGITDPTRSSLLSWGDDDSDDEESREGVDQNQEGPYDRYTPSPKNGKPVVPVPESDSSLDSMEAHSFSNMETPLHANNMEKSFSFNVKPSHSMSSDGGFGLQPITEHTEQSATRSSTGSTTNSRRSSQPQGFETREDESISNRTGVSSCGSSSSVIHALAEMLPNTNAYNSLIRVMSKHPEGITIGKLMLQAPEFKNFLSHCTDRRCEAQIKLAHTVLQQCQGISYQHAPDGSVLYFQVTPQEAPEQVSIVTRRSREESGAVRITTSDDIDTQAANLFAASEFVTTAPSPRKSKKGPKEQISTSIRPRKENARRPANLDTISSLMTPVSASPLPRSRNHSPNAQNFWPNLPATPRGRAPSPLRSSRAQSPSNLPATPRGRTPSPIRSSRAQSPSTPMSREQSIAESAAREQSIAESAARILAHAQSMTTPTRENKNMFWDSPKMKASSTTHATELAAHMFSGKQFDESLHVSPQYRSNRLDYRGERRMYFFTDEMPSHPPAGTSFVSQDCAPSPMTTDTASASSSVNSAHKSSDSKSATGGSHGSNMERQENKPTIPNLPNVSSRLSVSEAQVDNKPSVSKSTIFGSHVSKESKEADTSSESKTSTGGSHASPSAKQGFLGCLGKGMSLVSKLSVDSAPTIVKQEEKISGSKSPAAAAAESAEQVNKVTDSKASTASSYASKTAKQVGKLPDSIISAATPKSVKQVDNLPDPTMPVATSFVSKCEKKVEVEKPSKKEPRNEVIEEIALDMFPTTNMHYELLLALAENPNGLTWESIDARVPRFAPFVQNHGAEKGFDDLEPWSVLQACVSIVRKKEKGTDLYFINAPKTMPSRSVVRNNGDETSMTSESTDESSDTYRFTAIQGPLALSLAFAGSDTAAVLFFLRRIDEDFTGRVWPASWEQGYQFLSRLDKECAAAKDVNKQMFHSWLNQSEGETPQPRASNRKKALAKILKQLHRLKCLSWKNNDLHWDEEQATAIVIGKSYKLKRQQNRVSPGHDDLPISLVDTMEQLEKAKEVYPFCKDTEGRRGQRMVSIMCEGAPDQLYFVVVGTESVTYIFDCVKLEAKAVCEVLSDLFANKKIIKAFHDVHLCAGALAQVGCLAAPLSGVFDTQLALEALTGVASMTSDQMLRQLGIDPIAPTHPMKRGASENRQLFGLRPLPKEALSYAADRLGLQAAGAKSLFSILNKRCRDNQELWNSVQTASDATAAKAVSNSGRRRVCFDTANGYELASEELLAVLRPADVQENTPISISNDVNSLLESLPEGIVENVPDAYFSDHWSSISFEPGRPATAWVEGQRIHLGRRVTSDDLENLGSKLDDGLESDHNAGLKNQLHRVSAVRNWKNHIVGLTINVGSHVVGAANMIMDLLFSDPTKSILFLGETGSGKTTVLRDAARLLAEEMSVSIVDTNSEIAGCCDAPHSSIGLAKRVMVHKREEQHNDMMRCLRDQRPSAIVVDELDTESDISAAKYCRRHSTRLMASAVGTVEDLLIDPSRSQLLGGVKDTGSTITRASEPIFDVIVELRRGAYNEWRIFDAADAVDAILSGNSFEAQVRTRNPETGSILLAFEQHY